MLFVSQEERRASDTVFFTSENNDIANQSVDTSFYTSGKNRMTNQLASLARRDYFYLDAFWRVNLGMYIIKGYINLGCLIFDRLPWRRVQVNCRSREIKCTSYSITGRPVMLKQLDFFSYIVFATKTLLLLKNKPMNNGYTN